MSVVHGRREDVEERAEDTARIRDVCDILFEEPSTSISPPTSKLDIKVYELDLSSHVLAERIEVNRKRVSKALEYVSVVAEAMLSRVLDEAVNRIARKVAQGKKLSDQEIVILYLDIIMRSNEKRFNDLKE